MPDEMRREFSGNGVVRSAKRGLEDDASPVHAKRRRLMDLQADIPRIEGHASSGSQESELELFMPQAAPSESFRVNSRKIGGRQILEKTPLPPRPSFPPVSAYGKKEKDPPAHWSQVPPRHDLGVYSHNLKVDLDFHGRVLERVGLSKVLAYNIRRQGGRESNIYGSVASPDRRPFVIAADHYDMRHGEYQMVPMSKAFVLLGKEGGKPVYAGLTKDNFSRLSSLELKFLGFGTVVPERFSTGQNQPDSPRPLFSRNYALMNPEEKEELTSKHIELSQKPTGFTNLAQNLAQKARLSADLVSNARLGAPLLLNENEAVRLASIGRISVPRPSNLCLLTDIEKRPAYIRLNTYQSGKLSERELYRLGFEPSWTQGLAPQEKYQLGLLPAGSMALADAVRDETKLTELARTSNRSGETRASERTGSSEREEISRSRDRSRYPGR
ncbi:MULTISPECIES: hypothetical protein [unclassified Rhizobium]|uniref:hypothetical protein n=1 Tax=unclassified Rhizobium TaxID=2613769 RepID=UPI0017857184|nr:MULTISPECIES: hypothetical protein [unclassified Rhizobium]MBD8689870.1 hypothetical protein [Rhizobium sp. CFBP 13644]MBD8694459.1 hypothetical protein [Rhizobium sp. CFBP 13717]